MPSKMKRLLKPFSRLFLRNRNARENQTSDVDSNSDDLDQLCSDETGASTTTASTSFVREDEFVNAETRISAERLADMLREFNAANPLPIPFVIPDAVQRPDGDDNRQSQTDLIAPFICIGLFLWWSQSLVKGSDLEEAPCQDRHSQGENSTEQEDSGKAPDDDILGCEEQEETIMQEVISLVDSLTMLAHEKIEIEEAFKPHHAEKPMSEHQPGKPESIPGDGGVEETVKKTINGCVAPDDSVMEDVSSLVDMLTTLVEMKLEGKGDFEIHVPNLDFEHQYGDIVTLSIGLSSSTGFLHEISDEVQESTCSYEDTEAAFQNPHDAIGKKTAVLSETSFLEYQKKISNEVQETTCSEEDGDAKIGLGEECGDSEEVTKRKKKRWCRRLSTWTQKLVRRASCC